MKWPRSPFRLIRELHGAMGVTQGQIEGLAQSVKAQATTATNVVRALREITDQMKVEAEQRRQQEESTLGLRAFADSMEMVDIRRKFGGEIDIDYDKLLANLGDESLKNLDVVLKEKLGAKKPKPKTRGSSRKRNVAGGDGNGKAAKGAS